MEKPTTTKEKSHLRKETISASRITSYQLCGEAFRRRYELGEVRPPGLALIKGRDFHKLTETNNKQKIETKEDLPLEEMKDYVSDRVDISFEQEVLLTKEEKSLGRKKIHGDVKDILVASAGTYRDNCKDVMPREVESFQRLVLPEGMKDILYVMDIETVDDKIIDYKFSGKKKNQLDVDSNLGLTAYSLAFESKHGRKPKEISFHNYVGYITPKQRELKTFYNHLVTERNHIDYENFLRRAESVIKGIDSGVFPPAPVGSWKCSRKFCEYWEDCIYVNYAREMAEKENKE